MSRTKDICALENSEHEFFVKIPSKIIPFGEHLAGDTYDCVAMAINMCSQGTIKIDKGSGISGTVSIFRNQTIIMIPPEIHRLPNGVHINVSTKIKVGCGLGSSAVLSLLIAISKEAWAFVNSQENKGVFLSEERISKLHSDTFLIEKSLTGCISGIDHSTIMSGGIVLYKHINNGKYEVQPIQSDLFNNHSLVLWECTGQKNRTLSHALIKDSTYYHTAKQTLKAIDKEATRELCKKVSSLSILYLLIRKSQQILTALGISTPEIEEEVEKMREQGIECKLIEGGASIYLFTIVPKNTPLRPGWQVYQIDYKGIEATYVGATNQNTKSHKNI
ncbi:mevalonate kinase [Nematocida sp. AWRm80]|nr:mevalonate kinase [Nematocida sp. AWRm80]